MHGLGDSREALGADRREVDGSRQSAESAWLLQMLLVAFSRRMCCSRVESVSTKAVLPSRSTVRPTTRPGIWRMCSCLQVKKPKPGPPNDIALPSGCPSPTTMSAPRRRGGLHDAEHDRVRARPRAARRRHARAAPISARSSRLPKKFGLCTSTAATSPAPRRSASPCPPRTSPGAPTSTRPEVAASARTVRR